MIHPTKLAGAALAFALLGGPALSQNAEKREHCAIQRSILSAVIEAKLASVREGKAAEKVIAEGDWPEKYDPFVPLYVGEVYKLRNRDLKKTDQPALWEQACLQG